MSPIDRQLLILEKFINPNEFVKEINQLIIDEEFNSDSQPPRHKPYYKNFWLPTPETCKHPERLQGVEKRIYDELSILRKLTKVMKQNFHKEPNGKTQYLMAHKNIKLKNC